MSVKWFRENGVITHESLMIVGKFVFEFPVRFNKYVHCTDTRIGAFSYVSHKSEIFRTSIGRYCSIGAQCEIGPSKHPSGWATTSPFPYQAIFSEGEDVPLVSFNQRDDISIGNDVWIGSNVAIMGGVSIGDGAIIAYGSVVTKDVAPYSIVGGVPAKEIRKRFSEDLIERYQAAQWWQFDMIDAQKKGVIRRWDDPEIFLEELDAAISANTLVKIENRRRRLKQVNGALTAVAV